MSQHHKAAKWSTTSRKLRARMQPTIDAGSAVCWRCRGLIVPGTKWDVGHVEDASGRWTGRYAPEHALKRDCPMGGNRSAGGRKGASLTNHRRTPRPSDKRLPSW
ncbi:hypothetical protein FPZ11_05190 [Humibacter ginsenosidimutans]|uniref:Uncharacterized protein n=1 Tax=Humibacter ginsenosidimutans TaxID=2599293 RepID=A0A5B8M2S0_9MICO|nr:hypothetical protein FPZ11_05190 [Humibacter ginsenosidimutans]